MVEHDFKAFPELTNAQLETLRLSSPHKQITENFMAVVVKVHDGDTVTLRTDFRDFDFPLRIADIDAPELSEGGEEVRDWLSNRLLGETVEILINPKNRVGKFGRLIGGIMSLGQEVGDEMIRRAFVAKFGKKNEGQIPSFDKLMREVAF